MKEKSFSCQEDCQQINCNTAGASCCLKQQAREDRSKRVEEKIKASRRGEMKC
jgi:hypothetical protein